MGGQEGRAPPNKNKVPLRWVVQGGREVGQRPLLGPGGLGWLVCCVVCGGGEGKGEAWGVWG